MALAASTIQEVAVEIRPGVFRPDWSVVTAPACPCRKPKTADRDRESADTLSR
jgi:hypothetical protein